MAPRGGAGTLPAEHTELGTDRPTPAQWAASAPILGEHVSWGLGLAVPPSGAADRPLPCGIGWDGGSGTTWRSNPASGVTGIVFTQRAATSPLPPPLMQDFWSGLNAATTVL
jgi:hypothetical protein